MDISRASLQVFVNVAERGSIVRAADALGYTASAVSQRLSRLETSLEVELFERLGNRLQLTATGQVLLLPAMEALRSIQAFELAATERTTQYRTIRIGGFPSGLGAIVAPLLSTLSNDGIDVQLTTIEDEAGLRELRLGNLELMMTQAYARGIQRLEACTYIEVVKEPLLLLSAHRSIDTLTAAAELNWIMPGEDRVCGRGVRDLCHAAGFAPRIVADVDDFQLITQLLRYQDVVAVLPASSVPVATEFQTSLKLDDATRTIFAVHRDNMYADPTVMEVLRALKEARPA